MASYTDKIPTFNPYVQQLPVDAMLKVGAYKQEKYEEGVQKIQTSIDNIAGLDIANVAQQKYLQSKLDALGNDLTWVAAGDFSDFSLVNSVNGMTKQITKDEDVINAVNSTAKLRAGYKKRAELEKKGLTDKNNDDYYDMYASNYVNNKDVKASFNADYVPYTNIIKKLKDALVGAGESEDIVEEIFVTGNDGKPLITNGHYTYADAKVIDKLVTNKPAAMAAINNVLNEGSVKQQVGIDGWATYRNVEATTLLEPLKMQYDEEKSNLQQQQLDTTALLIAKNLSPEQKEAYTKANNELEAALLRNDKTFLSLTEQAENSPEEFKQNFYAQEFKQRLINQFVVEKKSRTYGTNEALQQQNWRDTMAFNTLQEKNKIAYQNRTLAISESGNQRSWMEFYRDSVQDPVTGEWSKKDTTTVGPDGKPRPKAGTVNANPIFKGDNPGGKVSAINIVDEDISKLTVDKDDIAFGMYADLMRINKNDANISDKDILSSVNKYAKQTGVTPSQFLNRWAFNIKNKYAEMGLKPPPNFQDDLTNYNTTSKNLSTKVMASQTALTQANEEAGVDKVLNDITKGKKEFKFNINGEIVTITPEDMLDITSDGMLQQIALGYGSRSRDPYNLQINQPNLTSKQNKFLSKFNTLSPEMKAQIYKEANLYKGAGKTISDARAKARKIYNDKLSKIVGVSDVITQTLPMGSADEIKASVANVTTYITGGERSFEGGEEGKASMIKALANPTGISWIGKKPTNSRETWTGSIVVTDATGSYKVNNVNHDDLESFSGKILTNYVETPIQDAINMNTNTKSTNPKYLPGSELAWTTAHLQENETNPDLLNSGWGYRADAVKAGGGYRMINYVRVPGTKKYVTIYGDYVAPEENIITNTFKTVTSAELKNLYLQYVQNQTQNK